MTDQRPGAARTPRTVRLRDAVLGEGLPEIIVPLTAAEPEELLLQAERAAQSPARILEWRIDHLGEQLDAAQHRRAVLDTLPRLRAAMAPGTALLATLRTAAEGGRRAVDDEQLRRTLEAVIDAPEGIDAVDVETSRGEQAVEAVVARAHARGVAVVGSFHDFTATPPTADLAGVLAAQRRAGADIPKIAVTPRSGRDVLRLLEASLQEAEASDGPHIAISMGPLGAVSRIAGEAFGSAATFATAGDASAPGQIDAEEVARLLQLLRP